MSLPDLRVPRIKAKVDTGARSSVLHAVGVEVFTRRGKERVRFHVHPLQRSRAKEVVIEEPIHEKRWVRSSTGHRTLRPVIVTALELMGQQWPIELTLVSRDMMGFRMLLGRSAVRERFLVDPSRSFLAGVKSDRDTKRRPR